MDQIKNDIFISWCEVHTCGTCMSDLSHINSDIRTKMDTYWESHRREYIQSINDALILEDRCTTINLIITTIVQKIFLAFYNDDSTEDIADRIPKGLSTQNIIDYVAIKLHEEVCNFSVGVSDVGLKAYRVRRTLNIEAYTQPVLLYYEKEFNITIYQIEIDTIDFENKTREFEKVCTLLDRRLVESFSKLYNMLMYPEQFTYTSALSVTDFTDNYIKKEE